MNHITMLLSALLMMALVVMIAPNIFVLNRGKMLRNIALWLAIALGLAIIYMNFYAKISRQSDVGATIENSKDKSSIGQTPPVDEEITTHQVGEDNMGYTPPVGD